MTRIFAGTKFDIPPTCDICGELESECQCTNEEKSAIAEQQQRASLRLRPEEQIAKVTIEKRKGNRQVTVVEGLTDAANDLPEVLANLQSDCGTGGTVKSKEDRVELQGNHAERVRKSLRRMGYKVP